MKKYFIYIMINFFLLFSCGKEKQGDLLEIPVDIDRNISLPLSEIAEEITVIELETTDESLINPISINNIVFSEDEMFIATLSKILVFNKNGKFIRSIGSQGQGPGEYSYLRSIALDKKNKRLFTTSDDRKIMSYDLTGNFLKEKQLKVHIGSDINYINEELLLIIDKFNRDSVGGIYSQATLYRLDDDFQFVDNYAIRDIYFKEPFYGTMHAGTDFILKGANSTYVYYGDFFEEKDMWTKRAFLDTLYRFENNRLVPELKLNFKNDGIGSTIRLFNIYRSSRYIFARFRDQDNKSLYTFCFDTKNGKGYYAQNVMDDIHKIESPVRIRPFNFDTEMFYYLHAHINPGDLEEPNPTLYIGRLKK